MLWDRMSKRADGAPMDEMDEMDEMDGMDGMDKCGFFRQAWLGYFSGVGEPGSQMVAAI